MNFQYLAGLDTMGPLYGYCTEAEEFVSARPGISVTSARKAAEYIVKLIYASAVNENIAGMTLFDMLSDNAFVSYIGDDALLDAIHQIRRKGNIAVHEGGIGESDAMRTLEDLHFVAGEACVLLGIIEEYPPFDKNVGSQAPQAIAPSPAEEGDSGPEVDMALIQAFAPRLRSVRHWAELHRPRRKIINVHVDPRTDHLAKKTDPFAVGTDLGANGKLAVREVADWLDAQLPGVEILADYFKSLLTIPKNGAWTILSVKTGSTVLGRREGETLSILPRVDFVVYTPELTEGIPLAEQFRVFSRGEFLTMWETLGLIRYKVSTSAAKRYRQIYGPDKELPAETYADTVTVQSFTNSRKKHAQVKAWCEKMPPLTGGGLQRILG